METIDGATGEVTQHMPRNAGYAIDGGTVPAVAGTTGQFLDQIEDGAFSCELYEEIKDLAAKMTDLNKMTGNKQKGEVTIKVSLELEDGAFKIATKSTVKAPEVKRPKSIMWTDEHNSFSRFMPNQLQMFGLKSASGGGGGTFKSA